MTEPEIQNVKAYNSNDAFYVAYRDHSFVLSKYVQ